MTRIASDQRTTSAGEVTDRTLPTSRYGHFSADGREYVVTDAHTPRPWTNVIANPRIGLVISQTGSGFTWIDNSQLAVITRWQQDLTSDCSGKFLYVRDADSGRVWSLSPAPVWPTYQTYACHHGLGYTTIRTSFDGIDAEWTLFCPEQDTAELWRVALHNRTDRLRRLELVAYLEWCCGVAPSPRREFAKLFVETAYDAARGAIIARNHMWEVPGEKYGHWNTSFPYVSALACTEPVQAAQGDKAAFLGRNGTPGSPVALSQDVWRPRFGRHEDPVAAMRTALALRPGARQETGFCLAIGESNSEALALSSAYSDTDAIRSALETVQCGWQQRLSDHRVTTPDPTIDVLANDWLRYQAIVGRMWARCGYYQQSGAYGFRDQLQDSQVWLTIDPQQCRWQIQLHAAHQFRDGSAYHWWHPLNEQGLRTQMTDDLLWLPFVAANYIKETGDTSVLNDLSPFVDDPVPAKLLEHVRRAFARVFARTSSRGIPLIGAGDWNDGLSACGTQERGESFWLAHFLAGLLADWAILLDQQGDAKSAEEFRDRRAALIKAINAHGWDGRWYLRATLDDGSKLGSRENAAGRIFLNAQTWAILNDVAEDKRRATCWNAVKEHLITDVGALLLAPAFDQPDARIGYITRYAPGLRENGGVYTHAATWALAAACKMRDVETVGRLLYAINPAMRDAETYWAEPYVTPGNIDGPQSPYFGRGGWTWYTGSAAWLHRVISQWVLGVQPEWDGVRIAPCLPQDWKQAGMMRPYRGTLLDIRITRTSGEPSTGAVTLDGTKLPTNLIPAELLINKRHDIGIAVG